MHIIFFILKLIGWLLLIILGLVVLVTCLILFTPLRYQVRAKCDGGVESLAAEADFSVFFRLVRASVRYMNQELSWQFRLAWKKFSSEMDEEETKEAAQETEQVVKNVTKETALETARTVEKVEHGESVGQAVEEPKEEDADHAAESVNANTERAAKAEESSEGGDEKTMAESAKTAEVISQEKEEAPKKEEPLKKEKTKKKEEAPKKNKPPKKESKEKESFVSKINALIEKLKCTFQEICDKIETLRKKKERLTDFITDETHVGAFKKVLAESKRLIRRLLPKKFQMNIHFGFEDPSITGRVLGGISMIYPSICEHAQIQPDFQRKVLEGNVFLKGHVRACIFVSMGIRLLLNANVRRTLLDVKNFKL